jgi:fibronectin type 3 domain-containing protein
MRYFKFIHTYTVWRCLLRACVVSFLLAISVVASHAAEVRLEWDRVNDGSVVGYRVYYGTASRNYTTSIDAKNVTTYPVTGLQDGTTYRFAATVYNQDRMESGFSNEVTYTTPPGTITGNPNPVPTLTSISPSTINAGEAGGTLTVTGTNFISGSVVRWNGSNRTATYVSATQLNAVIPASDLTTAGTASVTVFNPTPGGGTSGGVTFTITPPPQTCTYSLSSSNASFGASAGTGSVTITAPSGCKWGSSSAPNWITVTTGSTGAGTGTFRYSVAANTTTSSRTTALTVAGQVFTVTQNGLQTFTVTASATSGGKISPAGKVQVTYGSNQTFSISRYPGYIIAYVKVDGVSVGKVTSYTFSNVTANHTITASFSH